MPPSPSKPFEKGPEPNNILDIGCSTGLSTLKLADTFPSARITGVDLSPHMLAVGRYFLRTREEQRDARGRVEYMHAAGEMTGMAEGSMDMVSLSLTSHELPAEATRSGCWSLYVSCVCVVCLVSMKLAASWVCESGGGGGGGDGGIISFRRWWRRLPSPKFALTLTDDTFRSPDYCSSRFPVERGAW